MRQKGIAVLFAAVLVGCAAAPQLTPEQLAKVGTVMGDKDYSILRMDYKYVPGRKAYAQPGKHTFTTDFTHPSTQWHVYDNRDYTFTVRAGYTYQIQSSSKGNNESVAVYELNESGQHNLVGYVDLHSGGLGSYVEGSSHILPANPCRLRIDCN